MKTAGIYVHFPFCKQKCHYCDFYSITNLSYIDKYVSSLLSEIKLRASELDRQLRINSIFFGGGTPSLLKPKHLEKIMNELAKQFKFSDEAESSLECNPGASDSAFFNDYKSLGINRLSIGVQSFLPNELAFLQRIHSADDAEKTIEKAIAVFNNVSIDLIFALPEQKIENLMRSLNNTMKFDLKHISCYSLIFEENTPLFDDLKIGNVREKDDDESAEMYLEMCNFLESNNFKQYEISNFAKEGYRCRHNLKYWHSEDVAAFGASAVGLLENKRYRNIRDANSYIKKISAGEKPEIESEKLTDADLLTEAIFLRLRADGINFEFIRDKFKFDLFVVAENDILQFVNNKYAKIDNNVMKLTSSGYYICDEITLKLLSKIEEAGYV